MAVNDEETSPGRGAGGTPSAQAVDARPLCVPGHSQPDSLTEQQAAGGESTFEPLSVAPDVDAAISMDSQSLDAVQTALKPAPVAGGDGAINYGKKRLGIPVETGLEQ